MPKPKILLTRKWPQSVEAAAREHFDVAFNMDDHPMSRNEIWEALENYDVVLATVTDDIKEGRLRIGNLWRRYSRTMELDLVILILRGQKRPELQ